MTGGSSAQAADWVGSTVGSSDAGAQLARITGVTTAGVPLGFWVNLESTRAAVPSAGLTTGSTGPGVAVIGELTLQIRGGSTGYSVASLISGYVQVEIYRR